MARIQPLISNFSWGEMSPIMQGRTDLTQVKSSCQILENFFCDPHGGIRRRRGTKFVAETKYSGLESRLIPFIYSRDQSWMMEVGDYYIRFFREGKTVVNPGNVQFYRADGNGDTYFYPHPTVATGDIETFVEPDFTTPVATTNTLVGPSHGGKTYIEDFRDASWDKTNGFNNGAGATDIVSDGLTGVVNSVFTSPARDIAMGAVVDLAVDLVSVSYVVNAGSDSSATDVPLNDGAPPLEIFSFQPSLGKPYDNVTVDYQMQLEDTSGNRTSNFTWTLKRNGSVIDSGSELAVGSPGFFVNVAGIQVQNLTDADIFTLEVAATGNHGQSLPQVSGSAQPTTIKVNYEPGRGGEVRFKFATNKTTEQTVSRPVADVEGGSLTWQIGDQAYFDGSTFIITIEVDPFINLTIDNPTMPLVVDGWEVQLGSVPAADTIIYIRDASQVDPAIQTADAGILAAGEVFEIPTPYAAEHVKDLHFVQANDIMYIVHERYHPRVLKRYSIYDWRIEQPDFTDGKGTDPLYIVPEWAKVGYDPALGYPRTVQFFQQRLIFGGTESQPQTVWGSRVADFENFARPNPENTGTDPTPLPDDAVELTIAAQTQEEIQWLASARALFIGTTGNEHRVTVNSFLAVDNLPDVTRQSQYGGKHIQPEFIGTAVMFVQRAGLEVRTYDLDRNANVEFYDSLNAAWLAEHITYPGVINMAFWKTPYSVLWCTRTDGVALTMTYDPSVVDIEEDLLPVGWARQITDGLFEWIAAMPGGVGERIQGTFEQGTDETWCIVQRTVNDPVNQNQSVTKRYVEYMPEGFYVDSAIEQFAVGAPTAAWSGADHLEGLTVDVIADGAVHPPVTIVNGSFTLNYPVTSVTVGLPYVSKMKSSKWEVGNPSGTGQTATIRWNEIFARIDNSAIPMINGQQAAIRNPQTPMNIAEPLFTGDVTIRNLGLDKEGAVEVETEHPYPCHLLAIFGSMGIHAG